MPVEASSDAIGHMSLDETRDLLIISVPDYLQVYIVDAKTLTLLHIIDVEGQDIADTGGPGYLQSFMHEASGTLMVYNGKSGKLSVYDGTKSFERTQHVTANNKFLKDFPYGTYMDQVKGVLYLGNEGYAVNGKRRRLTSQATWWHSTMMS